MIDKVSHKRWLLAQKRESDNWKNIEGIVQSETKEIKKKYSGLLKNISKEIGLKVDWTILDLGCGATCISSLFSCKNKFGIDPLSDDLLISNKVIHGVKVEKGRGEEIPFKNNNFNLVICRNVIDHSENPKKIISESKRVLTNNGFFILSCYVYPRFISLVKNIGEIIYPQRNIEHPFTFTMSELERLCVNDFSILKRYVVFEGKHSTDYGKVGIVGEDKSILNKIITDINNKILNNNWFVREYFLLLKVKK